MMIPSKEARQLSSNRELSLISSSLPPALQTLSAARLKLKISRARKLRQKYQDLYRRQKLASKSRMTGTPYERLNLRTLRKKVMFAEALTRLRQQLAKVASPPARTSARTSARVSRRKLTATARPSAYPRQRRPQNRLKRSLKRQAMSPESHKTMKLKRAGYKRRQTHAAASTRRRQVKRDSRGRS
jgi:hypothetical protein